MSRINDFDLPELPEATVHRSLICIPCQDGDLGLLVDLSDFGPGKPFDARVSLYAPTTSAGMLRKLREGDFLLLNQRDRLVSEILLQICALLGSPTAMNASTATFNGPFPYAQLGIEPPG